MNVILVYVCCECERVCMYEPECMVPFWYSLPCCCTYYFFTHFTFFCVPFIAVLCLFIVTFRSWSGRFVAMLKFDRFLMAWGSLCQFVYLATSFGYCIFCTLVFLRGFACSSC